MKGNEIVADEKISKLKDYLFLHGSLLFYSIGGIFSKKASGYAFLSKEFILFYGLFLMVLFVYAILWQQILKRFPLTEAFANKAIVILWGIIWGYFVFGETLRWGMILGAAVIVGGIYLVVSDE